MGLFDGFKKLRNAVQQTWTSTEFIELGKLENCSFSGNVLENELVRACINSNATHTSKASPRVFRMENGKIIIDDINNRLERLLNERPNPYMNAMQYLYRIRAMYEYQGTAFVYIERNPFGMPIAFYPIFYSSAEALVDNSNNIKGYRFSAGGKIVNFAYEDLIVLRRDYLRDPYFGESNSVLFKPLTMINIADKGVENAVNLSAGLRGILKSTKGMLDKEDRKGQRDNFIRDYINMSNSSGIASIDSTQEFIPVNMEPQMPASKQMELFEKRIMRYFKNNEAILMNKFTEQDWAAYYEGTIEPFLMELSLETGNKSFTDRDRAFGNKIIYESNKMQYMSAESKLKLTQLVDRGVMSINEYRSILNLPPIEGGDKTVIRKEYMETSGLEKGAGGEGK